MPLKSKEMVGPNASTELKPTIEIAMFYVNRAR
jgi:hypothetical protein